MYAVWVEKVQPRYAGPVKERLSALNARRTQILDQIDQVEHEPLDVRPPSDDLYRLQQEYNLLVDEETDLMRRTFTDPLEALPPELWPSFLPKDTDEMMILTTVSRQWCQALLSTPTLWTTVMFDDRKADYMAKATTSLHLSRPVGINLNINITAIQWETIASIILPECARIRTLSIHIRRVDENQYHNWGNVTQCLTILGCFEELPALQTLILPFYTTSLHWSLDGLAPVNTSSNPNAPSLFRRAPLLLDAAGFSFSPQTLLDPAFKRLERVTTFRLDESTVEILSQLHNLTYLHVSEAKFDVPDGRNLQQGPVAPLSSITQFKYYGLSALPTLKFIGNHLTHLEATIETFDLAELLESIGRFYVLTHLTLKVCFSRRKRGSDHSQVPVPRSSPVRTLSLTFYGVQGQTRHGTPEQELHREIEVNRGECAVAFRFLILVIPLAERVMIEGQCPADTAIGYIRSLRNLRSLSMSVRSYSPAIEKPTIDWLPCLLPADYLDKIQTNSLRHLDISNNIPRSLFLQFSEIGFDEGFLHARRYTVSSTPIPSVLSLALSILRHLHLDLHTFPNLRTVELSGYRSSSSLTMRASDFFEELLLQPNQWPSLENIGINGEYMEWDILILMLERRNFVAESSVSRITTLSLSEETSYKLLYPITQLLNGKFPERPSLSEFSIEEIGRRLCNSAMPGCHQCIRAFRPCDSPINGVYPGEYWVDEDDGRLGWEYELPHERLRPDPPLSPDMAKWLSGKRARRLRFVEMTDATRTEIKRGQCCDNSGAYNIVAGYSMDGAKFEV